jgi:hypothetical protein
MGLRRVVGRFLLLVALVAAGGLAVDRIPAALADVELFELEGIAVEGVRHLPPSRTRAALAVPAGASVWDDPEPWLERLRRHPLVLQATVRRRLPDSLVVTVVEREAVALVATPTLVPVDSGGRTLPVDPTLGGLDLPIVRVWEDDGAGGASQVGVLAREVARWGRSEPGFLEMISEVAWHPGGYAVALWGNPPVEIRFHPPLTPERVAQGLTVLGHLAQARPDRTPRRLDLRYLDQVIAGF